jgi:hypothetical protein
MSTTVTGGCACGAVRYEYSADPVFMGNCHCRDCQRTTGSAYVAAVRTEPYRLGRVWCDGKRPPSARLAPRLAHHRAAQGLKVRIFHAGFRFNYCKRGLARLKNQSGSKACISSECRL